MQCTQMIQTHIHKILTHSTVVSVSVTANQTPFQTPASYLATSLHFHGDAIKSNNKGKEGKKGWWAWKLSEEARERVRCEEGEEDRQAASQLANTRLVERQCVLLVLKRLSHMVIIVSVFPFYDFLQSISNILSDIYGKIQVVMVFVRQKEDERERHKCWSELQTRLHASWCVLSSAESLSPKLNLYQLIKPDRKFYSPGIYVLKIESFESMSDKMVTKTRVLCNECPEVILWAQLWSIRSQNKPLRNWRGKCRMS